MITHLIIVFLLFVFLIFIQPLIVVYFSWRQTNFSDNYLEQSLPYGTDVSGFDGLPNFDNADILLGHATNNQETCENGYYIGIKEATNVNCTKICNSTNKKQFIYKYINSNDVIINNNYLRKGGWCLPTTLARCNLNISTAVKSLGHYECISKFPQLLGGQYGNDIIGCAPIYKFNDNLKNITYNGNVPSSLTIGDIDEKLPNSNEFRYTCNTNNQFNTFSERPDLGNRFQMFYDSCNFFDAAGKMVSSKCVCSNKLSKQVVKPLLENQQHDTEEICSTCTSGYEIIDENYPQFGSKYGVSIGINCVDPERIEYYKSMSIQTNGVIPCGVKTLTRLRESNSNLKYGCHRALLNVTNSYTPEMLQILNG